MTRNLPWPRLIQTYERELRRLFSLDRLTPEALNHLANSAQFRAAAWRVAERMVTGLSHANARSWREAANKGHRGRDIFEALQKELRRTGAAITIRNIVAENARLIRSIPLEISEQITQFALKEQMSGNRLDKIEAEIRRKAPQLTASKIRLIARTEIGKAESAITQTRSEQLGITHYQWQTSEDSRVRKSHRNMDGVIVPFSEPPSPEALVGENNYGRYHAGATFQCRCVELPLVSLDEVSWPARVFTGSSIVRMTRTQFARAAQIAA